MRKCVTKDPPRFSTVKGNAYNFFFVRVHFCQILKISRTLVTPFQK